MRKPLRYWPVLMLTAAFVLGTSLNTFAEIGYGPGYIADASTDDATAESADTTEETTDNTAGSADAATEETSAAEISDSDPAVGSEAQNEGAAAELQEENEAAAAEAALHQIGPLDVPMRMPSLQTTVLLSATEEEAAAWSPAFVNDQWVENGGRTFTSISIFLTDIIGNVHYRAYTSAYGWTAWAMNGQQTAHQEEWVPIEAIQIRFSGPVHNDYDIYYTTSLTDGTNTDWAKNGASAGTMGLEKALTGFRMAFFRNIDQPDLDLTKPVDSVHADGVQFIGADRRYISGNGANFTGWAWDDTERYYFNDSWPVTGWQYIDGYKFYFAEDGKLLQDLEPLLGGNGPFHLMINKEMNCMTVLARDGNNGFIIPLKTFLLSTGDDTPLGTFKTPEKYRWRLMNSGVYCQYATRLGSGLPFLMHSIIYDRPNSYSVWASTYNHLGIARSAGCIRLLSIDAKWVYDHCAVGTSVTVYNSPIPGPYERPTISTEIPFEQTWDPTDPEVTQEGIAVAAASILAAFGL